MIPSVLASCSVATLHPARSVLFRTIASLLTTHSTHPLSPCHTILYTAASNASTAEQSSADPGPPCPKQLKSAPGLSPIVHCEPFACVVLESSFFVILCNSVLLAVCSTRKLSWDMYVCVLNRCIEACIAGRRTSDMYMRCKQKGRFDIKES